MGAPKKLQVFYDHTNLGIVDSDQGGYINHAGWSSPVARQAHNLKVVGSNPTPATKFT